MARLSPVSGLSRHALGFAAFTIALQCAGPLPQLWQFTRTGWEQGAYWQLLTAQWVHLSGAHAAVNAVAGALLFQFFSTWLVAPVLWGMLAGGYGGVAVIVGWDSHCLYYAGASGALHGLWAGCALCLVLQGGGPVSPASRLPQRLGGAALLLLMLLKLWWQHSGSSAPGWLGIAAYEPAHLAGAAGGVLMALGVALWRAGAAARGPAR